MESKRKKKKETAGPRVSDSAMDDLWQASPGYVIGRHVGFQGLEEKYEKRGDVLWNNTQLKGNGKTSFAKWEISKKVYFFHNSIYNSPSDDLLLIILLDWSENLNIVS